MIPEQSIIFFIFIFLCLNNQLLVVLMPQQSIYLFLCLNNQLFVVFMPQQSSSCCCFSTLRSKRKTSSEVRLPARSDARHFNVDRKRKLAEVGPREATLRKADLLARSRARLCSGCPPPPGFVNGHLAQLCMLTSTSDRNIMPRLSVICCVCACACVVVVVVVPSFILSFFFLHLM